MAEGDGYLFNNFKKEVMGGTFDLDTDSIYCALVSCATCPDKDSASLWSDVSGSEVSGSGYTAGGEALSALALSKDNDEDRGEWDADDVTWSSLSTTPATPTHAILFSDTASSKLIGTVYLNTVTNGGNFTLVWSASGIVNLS